MSIRFERTPLILALVLALAAVGSAFLFGITLSLILAGAALLMVAVSLFAGSRNSDADDSPEAVVEVESATVAFGPNATEAPRKMTAKEKKATKKAQRDAKKAAAEREKFEKKAQAEAAKAAKKASKKGGDKSGEFDDFWVDTLKEMKTAKDDDFAPPPTPPVTVPVVEAVEEPVFPGFASPFGEAIETMEEVTATATAEPTYEPPAAPVVEEVVTTYRGETEEIPVITDTFQPPAAENDIADEQHGWAYAAYDDPNFTPPYTSNIALAHNKVGKIEDEVLDFEDDDPLSALPAEVDFVFQDDDIKAGSPAGRLKALADRFQSLAADINHDWEDLMQAYEQRDALVRALKDALGENERLKKEMLEKSMETKEIDSVSERLEEAKAEVARLYEDTRELSRLKYLNSQTTTRLRELRFAVASQPEPDAALLALVDQAIAESE